MRPPLLKNLFNKIRKNAAPSCQYWMQVASSSSPHATNLISIAPKLLLSQAKAS
jgi:hypothetical protein